MTSACPIWSRGLPARLAVRKAPTSGRTSTGKFPPSIIRDRLRDQRSQSQREAARQKLGRPYGRRSGAAPRLGVIFGAQFQWQLSTINIYACGQLRKNLRLNNLHLRSATMVHGNLDQELLLTLNTLAGIHPHLYELASNPLFRGFPIFFALVALWFSGDCGKRRSRMMAGLLAVCVATVLSVWFQLHVAVHTRPFLDPALHLNTFNVPGGWDHPNSFPSDTATLFFGLSTVVLLENRLIGLFCFLWVAVIIGIPKVIFGWHYPSDILGSLILGPACVVFLNKLPYPRTLFERALILLEGRIYVIHALLFVFLTEASNLFYDLERIGKEFVKMLHMDI
jgi:membrane-associated phospholipid phosphatase